MAYATKEDLEKHLTVTISSELDSYIEELIEASTDYVERLCGNEVTTRREFEAEDVVTTRFFDYKGGETIVIDDLRELTSFSLSGGEIIENDDFVLYPLNETPKEYAMLYDGTIGNSRSRFVSAYDREKRAVEVTGKFGYSTTPPSIVKMAVLTLAGAIIRENAGDISMKQISSQSLGSHSVSFADVERSATKERVPDLLERYKRSSHVAKTATITI